MVLATTAVGAYLRAKLKLDADYDFFRAYVGAQRAFRKRFEKGQGNSFYALEDHVNDPKVADKTFLIFEGQTWTFKQFYDLVLRYAGWLHTTHRVVPGEIVALDFTNCPAFLCLIIAIWSLGASPALINYNLTSKSLIHCVKVSTARLLIVDPEVAPKALTDETKEAFLSPRFRNDAFPLEIAVLDPDLESSLVDFPPYRAPDSAREVEKPTVAAVLIYTSGTTGMPKAAIVPWSKTAPGAYFTGKILGLRSVAHKKPDRYYTCMPVYHNTSFTLGFHACLLGATTLVLSRKFSVSNFWLEVRQSRATIILYVGETLRYLLAAPPTADDRNNDLRMAHGNGLRPDVWKRFRARFGVETIVEMYGSTEAPAATWNVNRNEFTDGAIGNYGKITELLSSRTQKFVKVDWDTESPWRDPMTGFCQQVPRGEAGEFLIQVDPADIEAKFQGYLGNSKASSSKIIRDVLKKGDAYFRTGDVMRFDREGRLWFEDRIGDTYRWKSENVSTTEVSSTFGHHPNVHEGNVYGVKVPGHEGKAGCVAILLTESALIHGEERVAIKSEVLQSLATYASNSLPKYAVPIFLRLVKDPAITGNNKQQKSGLQNQGIDLKAIEAGGSRDRLYWLKPGSTTYTDFRQEDFDALKAGKIKL